MTDKIREVILTMIRRLERTKGAIEKAVTGFDSIVNCIGTVFGDLPQAEAGRKR